MSIDQLSKTPEWIKVKTGTLKTEKLLTRIEFLREIGWEHYTEELYQEYLKSMGVQNRELIYESE